MSLDVLYVNKAEELMQPVHNQDLQSSTEALERAARMAVMEAAQEPKGDSVKIPVIVKGVEMLCYVMRIGEKMPRFHVLPRGREVIHRLIMRAAMADSVEEFNLRQTDEEVFRSWIFDENSTIRDKLDAIEEERYGVIHAEILARKMEVEDQKRKVTQQARPAF